MAAPQQEKINIEKNGAPRYENLTTIINGAKIDMVGRIFNAGIRYLYVLLLARLLGAELMGLFFLGVIVVEFFGVLSRMGFDTGVIKYIAMYLGKGDKPRVKGVIYRALEVTILNSIIISVLLFLAADFISQQIFHKPELTLVLKILALSLPFSTTMMIALSVTQAFHTLTYRVYAEFFANPLLNISLILIFFFLGWELLGVTIAYVLAFLVSAALALLFVRKLFPDVTRPKIKPTFETRKLITFSLPLLFVNVVNIIMMWTDVLMLAYFRSAAEVGIYSTVVKTAFFLNFIILSFTSIFAPRISELFSAGKIDELETLFKTVSRWIFALSVPIFLIIFLLSKNILSVFGAPFVTGYMSLRILAWGHLINASVGSVKYMLMMSEKEKLVMYNTVGICILNILLNVLLIPKYGLNGAAMATSMSIVLINIIMLIQVYTHLGIHPYSLTYLKPLAAGITVALIGLIIYRQLSPDNQFMTLVAGALFLPLGYLLLIKLLGLDEHDRFVLEKIRFRGHF